VTSPTHATTQASPQAERLRPTLGNQDWIRRNRAMLRVLFPPTWTRLDDPELVVRLGVTLKMLGVNWQEAGELVTIVRWLDRLGCVEAQPFVTQQGTGGLAVRRCRKT
jgi:hypothetical protein